MENKLQFQYTGAFFSPSPELSDHVYALLHDSGQYLKELEFIHDLGVLSPATKSRILAALHIAAHHKKVLWFMKQCTGAEVAKTLTLLDRARKAKQLEKRILKIKDAHPNLRFHVNEEPNTPSSKRSRKSRKRKIDLYCHLYNTIKSELESGSKLVDADDPSLSAVHELIQSASVSGSLARKVKQWARSLRYHDLQLIMLGLPKEPWRTIADIVHFGPDDFIDSSFLSNIYLPSNVKEESDCDCFVSKVKQLDTYTDSATITEQFFQTAEKYPQIYDCYSYIRTKAKMMAEEDIVVSLASNIPLDTALWYFEELYKVSNKCESIISERFSPSQKPDDNILNSSKLTYGKLVERILTFQRMKLSFANSLIPLTTLRLEALKERWSVGCNAKFAVFGDASSSMQLAIEASTVFATMVSACFNAELSFFSSGLVKSPYESPSTLEETFQICKKIRATGCTSLAATLWPYYSQKKVMDTFILVTDEIENTPCNNYKFAPLLADYKKHVNEDVKLIVVRVGEGYIPFQKSLELHGINYKFVEIDDSRPDLAKFDGLLGQLYMMTSRKQVELQTETEEVITDEDIENLQSDNLSDDDFVVV